MNSSPVETLARRHHTPLEIIRRINALEQCGCSVAQIAGKLDFSGKYINSIFYLLERGERRLMAAIENGVMPYTVAIDIALAKNLDVRKALADGYEAGTISGKQVLAIRRIVEQGDQTVKAHHSKHSGALERAHIATADSVIRNDHKETERQKLKINKAALVQARLPFIVSALRSLLAVEGFTTLLSGEHIHTMPKPLAKRIGHFKAAEETYGADVLNLVIATGFVSRLIDNEKIELYLGQYHPEILQEFRAIVSAASLDQSPNEGSVGSH
jgi:ParB family transcriptional regulator, chromosome partitioning protein